MSWLKVLLKSEYAKKASQIFSKKVPAYIAIICFALGAIGCSYMLERPSMKAIPLLTTISNRIADRAEENENHLAAVEKMVAHAAKNIPGDSLDKQHLLEMKKEIAKYRKSRDELVRNLYMFLELSLDEYEAIFRVTHGNIPEDYKKVLQAARKRVAEEKTRIPPSGE